MIGAVMGGKAGSVLRDIIRRYLAMIAGEWNREGDEERELWSAAQFHFNQDPIESCRALALELGSKKSAVRVTAGTLITVLGKDDVVAPLRAEIAMARQVVAECLRGGATEDALRCSSVYSFHGAPRELLGPLTRLLRPLGSDLAIVTALALRRFSHQEIVAAYDDECAKYGGPETAPIATADIADAIRIGMGQDVPPMLRSGCAAAVLEAGETRSALYSTAIATVKAVPENYKYAPLCALAQSRVASEEAIHALREIIDDSQCGMEMRLLAAHTLGDVCRAEPSVVREVITAHIDSAAAIVHSVLLGLSTGSVENEELIELCAGLVQSPQRRVGVGALWCLAECQPFPESALSAVEEWCDRMADDHEAAAVTSALIGAKAEALPIVRACAESGAGRKLALVHHYLMNVDVDVVRVMLDISSDDEVDGLADAMIRVAFDYLRARGEPLMPELLQYLDRASEELRLETYLHCIERCGVWNATTIEAVVKKCCDGPSSVANVASNILRSVAEVAMPVVQSLCDSAEEGGRREKLAMLIRQCGPDHGAAPKVDVLSTAVDYDQDYMQLCVEIGNSRLLRVFVEVVNVMRSIGGMVPLGQVALELAKRRDAGVVPPDMGVTKSALSMNLSKLQGRCGKLKLFTYDKGKAGEVTPEGEKLYAAAKVYLHTLGSSTN